MKNFYLLFLFCLLLTYSHAQEEELIPGALIGSCLEPESNMVNIYFDYSKNCPQADPEGLLDKKDVLGFHSGINDWATIVEFSAEGAATFQHLGNGIYALSINTLEYYGTAMADIQKINFVIRSANPNDSWDAAARDDKGGGGFGGDEPCNDFVLVIDNMLSCAELAQESSASLLGSKTAANSCVNTENGTVTIQFDQSLNCMEADPESILDGATALGFHSGANDWASTVSWDSENAVSAVNDGNNIFSLTINIQDYYGIPLDSLRNIKMVLNNGIDNPADPWSISGRDDRDGGFGGTEPCSDLVLLISEAPACPVEPETVTSKALLSVKENINTCVDPNTGRARIAFDNSLNCPEADTENVLANATALGFHSGANAWSSIVSWDDAGAKQAVNNGEGIFSVVINPEKYYGIPLDSLSTISMVMNNGVMNPEAAWDVTGKDERNGGFGGDEPCSDLFFDLSEAPSCDLSETVSSHALLNGLASSCVDTTNGLVKIDFDYNFNCPEADSDNLLMGAEAIAFHSGVNDWAIQVPWDDEKAQNAANQGDNLFSLTLDIEAYYGLPLDSVATINFLFNNGLSNPDAAWDNKGEDSRDGTGFGSSPCSNLTLMISEAPACDLLSTGTVNYTLEKSLRVYPNPFSDQVIIEFDNPDNKQFNLSILDISGRVMRQLNNVSGNKLIIEKGQLQRGMYFAVLSAQDGSIATAKLLVK